MLTVYSERSENTRSDCGLLHDTEETSTGYLLELAKYTRTRTGLVITTSICAEYTPIYKREVNVNAIKCRSVAYFSCNL